MGYRRYYSAQNRDGSQTVVSVGPGLTLYAYLWKAMLWLVVVAWPLALHQAIGGWPGWVVALVVEALWLGLAIFGMTKRKAGPKINGR